MPAYLLRVIKNALKALAAGDVPAAIAMLKFFVEEVESGSYQYIGQEISGFDDVVRIDDSSGFDAG